MPVKACLTLLTMFWILMTSGRVCGHPLVGATAGHVSRKSVAAKLIGTTGKAAKGKDSSSKRGHASKKSSVTRRSITPRKVAPVRKPGKPAKNLDRVGAAKTHGP